ncbi:hypothetical protein BGZ99_001061 [Dissophora globulifera]|uniref:Secreted lipase n=1 Tax=Dissophora globulifera TaxID=979702 RepID=A0A9P6RP87_9FUNG|nr:hypothetical protein BGZ99_001061 [Dissophora globulifera]
MKFTISSIVGAALLALSASLQVSALPTRAGAPAIASDLVLQKRSTQGINNYACQLTAAHPRPVILVHATLLTVDSWSDVASVLINRGYCVFGLTYGKFGALTAFGGLAPIEQSAQELGTFADNVMAKMGVSQVDIVGHSQGGILARYWMKYLGGNGKVNRHVGVSPITHGTTLDSIATLAKALNLFTPSEPLFDAVAPSFFEMVVGSSFMNKLNAGGDVAPGVIHSNIATRLDEVVTPYQTCFENDAGVTNVVLQDLCAASLNEHLTMINSNVVIQFILNQLDPSTAQTANCLSLL